MRAETRVATADKLFRQDGTKLGDVTLSLVAEASVRLEFGRPIWPAVEAEAVRVNGVGYCGSITLDLLEYSGWVIGHSHIYREGSHGYPTKSAELSLTRSAIEIVEAWAQSPEFREAQLARIDGLILGLQARRAQILQS